MWSWDSLKLIKGVPQGSVLGPMLFDIFINDLTYVVENTCPLYNYADDNTLGFWHNELDDLKLNFEYGSKIAIEWFQENHMKVNVSKFQSTILKPKGVLSDFEFYVSGHSLKPVSSVKLLGVKIDERLTFDDHISALQVVPRRLIKSMLYAVSLNTLPRKIVCLFIMPLLHPILIIVILFGIFAATEVCIS